MIEMLALIQECSPNVHPQTMEAIIQQESNFNPWAIGINDGSQLGEQPSNQNDAISIAKLLILQGKNIDMGLGQINSANLARYNWSVEDVFNPCKNISYSAQILTENYERASAKFEDEQTALQAAISAYNTGNFISGHKNGYVDKVKSKVGYSVPAFHTDTPQANTLPQIKTTEIVDQPAWDIYKKPEKPAWQVY